MKNLKAIASYRMPRESKTTPSVTLSMTWNVDGTCRMTGGKWGPHEIHTEEWRRVRAHWFDYVANNMGRAVLPSITWAEGAR